MSVIDIDSVDEIDRALIEKWQRDFPLVTRPFAAVGAAVEETEKQTIRRCRGLIDSGLATRVGAVLAPNTIGASTLAAISVPDDRMEEVARIVDAESGVNHNYEREHHFNMWFVVTGADHAAVGGTLNRIADATGLRVLDLPMLCAYHIDLAFPIDGTKASRVPAKRPPCTPDTRAVEPGDVAILRSIEDGLPLVSRPFAAIGQQIRRSEAEVLARLTALSEAGIVRRFGIVVRHRAVGFSANAMAVWAVDDDKVDAIGARFAEHPAVTLCYRRRPAAPDWPYNLFVMVHSKERVAAQDVLDELNRTQETGDSPHAVLFSRRCFKQRGARLVSAGSRKVA